MANGIATETKRQNCLNCIASRRSQISRVGETTMLTRMSPYPTYTELKVAVASIAKATCQHHPRTARMRRPCRDSRGINEGQAVPLLLVDSLWHGYSLHTTGESLYCPS